MDALLEVNAARLGHVNLNRAAVVAVIPAPVHQEVNAAQLKLAKILKKKDAPAVNVNVRQEVNVVKKEIAQKIVIVANLIAARNNSRIILNFNFT